MPLGGKTRTRSIAGAQKTNGAGNRGMASTVKVEDHGAFDADLFFATVGSGRSTAIYKAKSQIFRQGAKCDAVFYIQKGQVQLTIVSKQGKQRIVGILGPGTFIGEGCIGGHPLYLASARAMTECIAVRVEAQTMKDAIHDHPEMSRMFMAFLLDRNTQIESDLIDQLFNSSEKRLARLLIMLAQVGKEAKIETIAAPISQELLASRVGTTRSRINYFLNKFRKLGLIEYNGTLKVHSALLNVVLTE